LAWEIFVPTKWDVLAFQVANYQSYHNNQAAADTALKELRVAGKLELVNPADLSSTIIAPLGVVPKPGSNKIRVIHNLSILVNDSVTIRDLSLPTIEEFLKWVSPGAWMWKRDWKGGYQQFFVEKSSRRMLGFCWKNNVWRYAVLPFGLNASVTDFCQFSFFVGSLLQAEGILVWNYIDDKYGLNLSESAA
jgi:hypothetical protein